jgi:hypothetical protein
MDSQGMGSSLKPFVWGAIAFHVFLAFHNYCGVDGANFFSYYSQYVFGVPGGRCNYFSIAFSMLALSHLMSYVMHIPFTACVKLIQSLCWIACSYLVVSAYCPRNTRRSHWWFIYLAFNPAAIFNIHYHVQYEAVALLCIIAGLMFYRQRGVASKIFAGLSWAVAISVKAFPALIAPLVFFDRRSGARDKTIFYASLMAFSVLPELSWVSRIGWARTFAAALGHEGVSRFGLVRLAENVRQGGAHRVVRLFHLLDGGVVPIVIVLLLVVGTLTLWKKICLFRAIGLYLALLLLCATKIAPQYFIFIIPFLVLSRNKGLMLCANAIYSLILAFFYLFDGEMNGSYCLLNALSFMSIGPGALAFWERFKDPISLYVWGYLYLVASFLFVWLYVPKRGETRAAEAFPGTMGLTFKRLLCGALLLLWGLSLFSVRFPGNPFSYPDNGLPEAVNCNTVLEPPSTLDWYGSRGEYELSFSGLKAGDAVRLSGDSYFSLRLADRTLGPYRGDGNKLYSFWWGISYPIPYEALRENGFKVTVINHLCSIRGINAITARLIGQERDWDPLGHMLDGKMTVTRCRIDGVDYGVEFDERRGWLDSVWLTIKPKGYTLKGNPYFNVFTINLLYIAVFFVILGRRLKMGEV